MNAMTRMCLGASAQVLDSYVLHHELDKSLDIKLKRGLVTTVFCVGGVVTVALGAGLAVGAIVAGTGIFVNHAWHIGEGLTVGAKDGLSYGDEGRGKSREHQEAEDKLYRPAIK
jgi:hypothetical protein